MNKKSLRNTMIRRRDAMRRKDVNDLSQKIYSRLTLCVEFSKANSFFIYVSKGNEVHTHDLIKKLLVNTKIVAVPYLTSKNIMAAYRIIDWDDLQPGRYGILEPRVNHAHITSTKLELFNKAIDIAIIPGVAYTKKKERLGMGGGYYDRFISDHPQITTIALCYEWQLVPSIPLDSTDIPVDIVITEKRIIT